MLPTRDGYFLVAVGDAGVPEHASLRAGKEQDAVARVDVFHVDVPWADERSRRGVAGAGPCGVGDVEAMERADRALPAAAADLRRGDVGDVRSGQRRAEAAAEASVGIFDS